MTQTQSVYVIDEDGCGTEALAPLRAQVLTSPEEVLAASAQKGASSALWIAMHGEGLTWLAQALAQLSRRRARGALLLLSQKPAPVAAAHLTSCFARSLPPVQALLPLDELAEVLAAPPSERRNLAIAVSVDAQAQVLYLYRGDLSVLVVPHSSFPPRPRAVPDFACPAVTDFGQTVRLGDYESSLDAILYLHDADFRRELCKRRREEEATLGASIRRLRLQRGVRLEDFEGLPPRTVGRIERGEVQTPQRATLQAIARRLRVPVGSLGDY